MIVSQASQPGQHVASQRPAPEFDQALVSPHAARLAASLDGQRHHFRPQSGDAVVAAMPFPKMPAIVGNLDLNMLR